MSLFDNWPVKESRIREHVERVTADHLAAGRSIYYGDGNRIICEDPDGRRFVVHLVGDEFEVVRELGK